jgi:hypothetical protein
MITDHSRPSADRVMAALVGFRIEIADDRHALRARIVGRTAAESAASRMLDAAERKALDAGTGAATAVTPSSVARRPLRVRRTDVAAAAAIRRRSTFESIDRAAQLTNLAHRLGEAAIRR